MDQTTTTKYIDFQQREDFWAKTSQSGAASIVPGKASEHKLDHVLGVESDLNIN
jgi:hypothetical protein